MKEPKQQVNPYPIRLTVELRGKLENAAKAAGRSLNAEMLLRLEQTFSSDFKDGDTNLIRRIVREEVGEAIKAELGKAAK